WVRAGGLGARSSLALGWHGSLAAFPCPDPSPSRPPGFLEQGILIGDRAQICRRYTRSSRFLWDLASVLPTDLLYLGLGLGVPAVRVNRFLRTGRLFEAFDRTETRTAHPNAFRIAKLMLYIFVTIHWNSCLYFALSSFIGYGADEWVYPNTSRPGFQRLRRQYLYSVYLSTLILTTVGDTPTPQREEEFLFMAADFLLAVMGFATIMGSMSSVISNMNQADAALYPNYDPVKGYLHGHRVDRRLQRRVADWHQHLQMNKKMTNELAILQHLPARLRAEVAVSVHLATLRKVQIFQSCEQSLLEQLVLKLRPQVYSPGEYVCKKGDIGREMYFIREGRLAVVGDDGVTQYAVLGEGLYFGEISIINIKGNPALTDLLACICPRRGGGPAWSVRPQRPMDPERFRNAHGELPLGLEDRSLDDLIVFGNRLLTEATDRTAPRRPFPECRRRGSPAPDEAGRTAAGVTVAPESC
uniref:Cyclic nucleotide gated channel subunit alpha 4 n=1 Tax=Sphenodon punctatus TaxID=8508 RepID=A0A8D0LCE4_SPHPU